LGRQGPQREGRSRAFRLTAALLLAAAGGPAAAAIAPQYLQADRDAAAHHVQIAVGTVRADPGGVTTCTISGTVAQVFRGPLAPGAPVTVGVPCYRHDVGPAGLPVGGALWAFTSLKQAAYLELFLADQGGAYSLAGEGLAVIAAPSGKPQIAPLP
jgi:hypothetical protein